MKKVLIYKDSKRIKQSIDFFNSSIHFMQVVHDKFTAAGLNVPIPYLSSIINAMGQPGNAIDYSTLDSVITSEYVNKGQLLGFVNSNDAMQIKVYIIQHIPVGLGMFSIEPNLMYNVNGQIKAKPDALTIIESRFSFYAENEKGAELATILSNMADAINKLSDHALNNRLKIKNIGHDIPGLIFSNSYYRTDISLIRDQETLYRNSRNTVNMRTINDC
jgi:hypothetical protein